jgi:DNA repair protein RadC
MKSELPDVPKIKFKPGTKVTKSKQAVKLCKSIVNQSQEFGVVISLKLSMEVADIRIVSIGCFNESTLCIRDVFRGAVRDEAYGIIFVHNHPGGTICPTKTDRKFVKALKKAGKLLDVEIVDLIIVAGKKWKSFMKEKL